MYSREQRIKAVELWQAYGKSEANVIRELGYPSHKMIARWYKDLQQEYETGNPRNCFDRYSKYTRQQKQVAVDYYLAHGRSFARTVRVLGYPSVQALISWCEDLVPGLRKQRRSVVRFSPELRTEAAIALCCRQGNAKMVAERYGVTRAALYKWRGDLLGEENIRFKQDTFDKDLPDDKNQLGVEIVSLKIQLQRLRKEKDILEAAIEFKKRIRKSI